MRFRPAVLPRLVVVALAACSLAVPAAGAAEPAELVVPDVRRQAFVFAKGTLEEAGFAWRVRGPVEGYAANRVVAQRPAPGTRVRDTGAPTITLMLERDRRYAERGSPEKTSPYRGTAVRLVDPPARVVAARVVAPKTKPKPASKAKPKPATKTRPKPAKRKPAFHVPGAPREPLHELRLDVRAKRLDAWLAKHPWGTDAEVSYWLYQHHWIVTGARYGWSHGEAALRLLIGVDRKIEARWGIGARSRALAERALAEVRAKSR